MEEIRKIKLTFQGRSVMEGAGVKLKRIFGNDEVPLLDPFLLLDHFGSDDPDDYLAGFPWHPHRGIETITYMLKGKVEHGDSLGNGGLIGTGDVQWMTAGNGIIHQEMPKRIEGKMIGFQLWVNLPSSHKMMNPRYRDVKKETIPTVKMNDDNVDIKVICGNINGIKGPVQDIVTDPEYFDIKMKPGSEFKHQVKKGHTVFAYIFEGEGYFDQNKDPLKKSGQIVVYGDGDGVLITTEHRKVGFLFVSGKPIKEPIAWAGPIVMNTQEELRVAFEEYKNGTFIKHK